MKKLSPLRAYSSHFYYVATYLIFTAHTVSDILSLAISDPRSSGLGQKPLESDERKACLHTNKFESFTRFSLYKGVRVKKVLGIFVQQYMFPC